LLLDPLGPGGDRRYRTATRDAAHLGGLQAAREMHQRRYQPAFALYAGRCGPEDSADILIDNDDPAAPRIVRLAR
jgi:uridine kinase